MAYAGICQQDDLQPHTDPYFSQRSQSEITANLVAAKANVNEVQTVSLYGFDGDGESFTLTYGGQTTAPIVPAPTYGPDQGGARGAPGDGTGGVAA